MTHAVFLPQPAALIELAPSAWFGAEHFAAIAGWRHLHYQKWVNSELQNELDTLLRVPPNILLGLVHKAVTHLCPSVGAKHGTV